MCVDMWGVWGYPLTKGMASLASLMPKGRNTEISLLIQQSLPTSWRLLIILSSKVSPSVVVVVTNVQARPYNFAVKELHLEYCILFYVNTLSYISLAHFIEDLHTVRWGSNCGLCVPHIQIMGMKNYPHNLEYRKNKLPDHMLRRAPLNSERLIQKCQG